MNLIYETSVISTGGRNGHIISDDNALDLTISKPKVMGGEEGYTNPEQLFAGGYSACFESSIAYIAKKLKINYIRSKVTAYVQLFNCEDKNEGFKLGVKLIISLPELDQDNAWKLINKAHEFCPYSQAIKNNVKVELELEKAN